MIDDQQAIDDAYSRDLFRRMQADLAAYVQAVSDDGFPEYAANLLLNFHGWCLANELGRRVSTPSGHAQFTTIVAVMLAGVTVAGQGYPDATPAAMLH